MLVGAVSMHRQDLSGMVMLKDNHVWASGSITQVGNCTNAQIRTSQFFGNKVQLGDIQTFPFTLRLKLNPTSVLTSGVC